jgi:hypothetical protein
LRELVELATDLSRWPWLSNSTMWTSSSLIRNWILAFATFDQHDGYPVGSVALIYLKREVALLSGF